MVADVSALAAQVRQQEEEAARNDEKARRHAALIETSAFHLSSEIGEAVRLATKRFNDEIAPFPARMVNECTTGGSCIVRLGRSRAYPKVYVTVSINLVTQRLEVTASRLTKIGPEQLPSLSFLLEVVENCVEVHDSQGFIAHSELAARLLQYFV